MDEEYVHAMLAPLYRYTPYLFSGVEETEHDAETLFLNECLELAHTVAMDPDVYIIDGLDNALAYFVELPDLDEFTDTIDQLASRLAALYTPLRWHDMKGTEMHTIPIVVHGLKDLETIFHSAMQHHVNLAVANAPDNARLHRAIAESFYGGMTVDFDMLLTFCIERVSPNVPVDYGEFISAVMVDYPEETGLLNINAIGHSCGINMEGSALENTYSNHPDHQCPGCILTHGMEAAFAIAMQAVELFHTEVSNICGTERLDNVCFTAVERRGDMITCRQQAIELTTFA